MPTTPTEYPITKPLLAMLMMDVAHILTTKHSSLLTFLVKVSIAYLGPLKPSLEANYYRTSTYVGGNNKRRDLPVRAIGKETGCNVPSTAAPEETKYSPSNLA